MFRSDSLRNTDKEGKLTVKKPESVVKIQKRIELRTSLYWILLSSQTPFVGFLWPLFFALCIIREVHHYKIL